MPLSSSKPHSCAINKVLYCIFLQLKDPETCAVQTSRMLLEAGICLAKGDCSPFCLKVMLTALL